VTACLEGSLGVFVGANGKAVCLPAFPWKVDATVKAAFYEQ
jgi:hypothetical protein